jgi:hypothetical protein
MGSTDFADAMRDALEGVGIVPTAAPAQAPRGSMPLAVSSNETGNGFIPPPWWDVLTFGMVRKRGACIFGPRGTGKTSAVHELAKSLGVTLITFQAAQGCTLDDLVGVRDLRDGKTVFTPGPLPQALMADCWLLIEEANTMHPGVFSKVNTLVDGSGDSLALPDGTSLPVGKGFRLALAFNEGANYTGTREVNPALRDRLTPIYTDYLPAEIEAKVLESRTGADSATCANLVGFANKVRAARANLGFDLSPRALLTLLDLMHTLDMDWARAFNVAILDLVGDPVDKKPQRDAISQIADIDGLRSWSAPSWAGESVSSDETEEEGEA